MPDYLEGLHVDVPVQALPLQSVDVHAWRAAGDILRLCQLLYGIRDLSKLNAAITESLTQRLRPEQNPRLNKILHIWDSRVGN